MTAAYISKNYGSRFAHSFAFHIKVILAELIQKGSMCISLQTPKFRMIELNLDAVFIPRVVSLIF